MDNKTKENYLPRSVRDDILRKKYEQYQDQIVTIELSNEMLQRALDIQPSCEKADKLGKAEITNITNRLLENKKIVESSYIALQMIGQNVLDDIIKK